MLVLFRRGVQCRHECGVQLYTQMCNDTSGNVSEMQDETGDEECGIEREMGGRRTFVSALLSGHV